jgi:ADP-ribose pyrophosphatase YjhB (NUDIX family)
MKNKIIHYKDFDKYKIKMTSGIVFIYNGNILLVKPNKLGKKNNLSYPKGVINNKEDIKSAAIRETKEEIGIIVPHGLLKNKNLYRSIYNEDNKIKIDYYYIINLDNNLFYKLFNGKLIIDEKKLQKNEIIWAGFLNKKISRKYLKNRFLTILNHF